ncbi:aminoglycoside 6-adenylyltransferase [Anaerocolumna xylanovorans]|uniref:Aminoglycoside 6-adenylyltransferase n=1 Tax=Anaerocolumna xylanovorans DSM 12503 TaxID=1121345 RepID=A0A1M7XWY3_9FIRM|nr:aminoglycoside 6-adenylyltransferase [Anaerocolumna xylanovorans]SHO43186.1 aminoglycoside 6-adenylyltransferase [Anaerocolumna xylanovorans DSM 12503]
MRSEDEMFGLILGIAKEDERIRAVYMNGSRTNPNVTRDNYQDYDIVYVVTETASFLEDRNWIEKFGELAMVQEPDSNDLGFGMDVDYSRSYGWLMLFLDGNRIDLHIQIKEVTEEEYTLDTLTIPLLDKDNLLPAVPPSNDSGYWVKKPSKNWYDGCCNEFWWCLNNVAKAMVRDQMPYAMRMYHETVHAELDKMLEWYIGVQTGFKVSVGMWGKYFKKYLPGELYELYELTYSDYHNLWESVFHSCELFHTAAVFVADSLSYEYNQIDEENMIRYLKKLRTDSLTS